MSWEVGLCGSFTMYSSKLDGVQYREGVSYSPICASLVLSG
jgi:hypothetical protein